MLLNSVQLSADSYLPYQMTVLSSKALLALIHSCAYFCKEYEHHTAVLESQRITLQKSKWSMMIGRTKNSQHQLRTKTESCEWSVTLGQSIDWPCGVKQLTVSPFCGVAPRSRNWRQ